MLEKGLIIDEPWIDYILTGEKTWEMRSKTTSHRGPIALIKKGSKKVFGIAELVDVLKPLSIEELALNFGKHRVSSEVFERPNGQLRWNIPYVLANVIPLEQPVPYQHNFGAVTFVLLDPVCKDKLLGIINKRIQNQEYKPTTQNTSNQTSKDNERSSVMSQEPGVPNLENGSNDRDRMQKLIGESILTSGNLNNHHFYLGHFVDKFPKQILGGSNKTEVATEFAYLDWGGEELVQTDIDASKNIFRKRSWVREFFEQNNSKVGDVIQVFELSNGVYEILMKR